MGSGYVFEDDNFSNDNEIRYGDQLKTQLNIVTKTKTHSQTATQNVPSTTVQQKKCFQMTMTAIQNGVMVPQQQIFQMITEPHPL